MAMDEKKMIEKLDESTKDITVPKKLLPENIMNTINDSKGISWDDVKEKIDITIKSYKE